MKPASQQFSLLDVAGAAQRAEIVRAKGRGTLAEVRDNFFRSLREWGYRTKLYGHRLKGRHPVQLLFSPDDPAPGSAVMGSALLGGEMMAGETSLPIDDNFWKLLTISGADAFAYAHRFHWLQDLAQVGDQREARAVAERLTRGWLAIGQDYDPAIWAAETLARRLIHWLAHAPLVMSSGDLVYRSSILLTMARQARHLMRVLDDADPGLPRLYTTAALTMAGVLLPGGQAWRLKGVKALERQVTAFVLPDGGPASRDPSDAIRAMQLLILVRDSFVGVKGEPPAFLQTALDRIGPFIRALRHGDSSFAGFNGVSAEGGHGTDAVLAASDARGKPIENAAHTGYQRMALGRGCVIVDSGPPPAPELSRHAHAGTGSFEFSHGADRIIVNMGSGPESGPLASLHGLARTSAAHSTLIIGDRNSCRILDDGRLGDGVRSVTASREAGPDGTLLEIAHDGYVKRFGARHIRKLYLRPDGNRLDGADILSSTRRRGMGSGEVLLRFHLHPAIKPREDEGGMIFLETRSGSLWRFTVEGGAARLEESLYLPRPTDMQGTHQIVVRLDRSDGLEMGCAWALVRVSSKI
ncbi:heparinase II/III family protein [Pseudokordiimonas caeni]|uniref:heparinase II/III family protein n=1 Tax=Pseudokordiimonas caeni TaxID=2997908 RepID=UPI002811AA34|nr:heparinase II/III family protein [Pseudokordiimonas caeni]